MKKLYRSLLVFIPAIIFPFILSAQVNGPNSPLQYNTTGGGNNWNGNATAVLSSDNNYSTVSNTGNSRYLRAKDFAFDLTSTDIVQGIQVEVEKKGSNYNPTTVIEGWSKGTSSVISNFSKRNGKNRLLVVIVAYEDGGTGTVGISWDGQALTRLLSANSTSGSQQQLEFWYLKETGVNSVGGGSHNIILTKSGSAGNNYFDILSAALFEEVDQISTFQETNVSTSSTGLPNPNPTSDSLRLKSGSTGIVGFFSNTNTTPPVANGGTNTFTINNGYTEATDVYNENSANAPGSGGSLLSAYKTVSSAETALPSATFNGTASVMLNFGVNINRSGIRDNSVRLQKNSVTVGNDNRNFLPLFEDTDGYSVYGGATDMWGTTWDYTDVNHSGFSAIFQVNVQNGRAEVDHMRVSVYSYSVLPVKLIEFTALNAGLDVHLQWVTATEVNNHYFAIERSVDGFNFDQIGRVEGAGNSEELKLYDFVDVNPPSGVLYYRLKQIDFDGIYEYSSIQSVKRTGVQEVGLIYPNPVSDWAKIVLPEKKCSIRLMDAMGRSVYLQEGISNPDHFTFDMRYEPDGIYYLVLESESGRTVRKFTKQSAFGSGN